MTESVFIRSALEELSPYVRQMHGARKSLEPTSKTIPSDILTEVDLHVQRSLVERIKRSFPEDEIMGEEEDLSGIPEGNSGRCWVIDPIDGTQNFMRGLFPMFGISLAFAQDGKPRAGGVALPVSGDVFLAESGSGATRNGSPLRVSGVAALEMARVDVDFGNIDYRERTLACASDLIVRTGQIRCFCAAVVGLCSIATGDADGYVHVGLKPWDFAAGLLIAQEAGAKATTFDGKEISLFGPNRGILVTNGLIHEEMMRVIV